MAPTGGPGEGVEVFVAVVLVVVDVVEEGVGVDVIVGVVALQVASQPLGVGESVWMPLTMLFPQMKSVLYPRVVPLTRAVTQNGWINSLL